MKKSEMEQSLQRHAHGALVTITDISAWSGRSKEYVKAHWLIGLDNISQGTSKFYYSGDVVQAIINCASQ